MKQARLDVLKLVYDAQSTVDDIIDKAEKLVYFIEHGPKVVDMPVDEQPKKQRRKRKFRI